MNPMNVIKSAQGIFRDVAFGADVGNNLIVKYSLEIRTHRHFGMLDKAIRAAAGAWNFGAGPVVVKFKALGGRDGDQKGVCGISQAAPLRPLVKVRPALKLNHFVCVALHEFRHAWQYATGALAVECHFTARAGMFRSKFCTVERWTDPATGDGIRLLNVRGDGQHRAYKLMAGENGFDEFERITAERRALWPAHLTSSRLPYEIDADNAAAAVAARFDLASRLTPARPRTYKT